MRSIRQAVFLWAAIVAVSALTASAASASQWYVGGKALSGSAGLAETTKVEESITFTMINGSAKITCTSAALDGESKGKLAEIIAPGSIGIGSLSLKGCAMTAPAHCSVESQINTDPLTAQLAMGTAPEDTVALAAKENEFVDFIIRGADCALAGEKPMSGKFTLLAPTGQTEQAELTLVGQGSNEKPAGTEWYGHPAYLSGKLKIKLASANKWSFH